MSARGRGTIVQVGSALAYWGDSLRSPYCGAEHAIQGFAESLRCELLHDRGGVRVTMVQLPALDTPRFDRALSRLRRKATPVGADLPAGARGRFGPHQRSHSPQLWLSRHRKAIGVVTLPCAVTAAHLRPRDRA